jgi:hypothetical protein
MNGGVLGNRSAFTATNRLSAENFPFRNHGVDKPCGHLESFDADQHWFVYGS